MRDLEHLTDEQLPAARQNVIDLIAKHDHAKELLSKLQKIIGGERNIRRHQRRKEVN